MKEIVLFAGTSEGRRIAERLTDLDVHTDVYVVSRYGAELLPESDRMSVHVGRLSMPQMQQMMLEKRPEAVIDATHPYAAEVTRNLWQAAENAGVRYIRVERDLESQNEQNRYTVVSSAEEAAEFLEKQKGRIFLTTGIKELTAFAETKGLAERLYVRALPSEQAVELCEKEGIAPSRRILMQGPFSEDLNEAMFRASQADWLVTKNSGKAGGFPEKCEAAVSLGMGILVIGKPEEGLPHDAEVLSFSETLRLIELHFQETDSPLYPGERDMYLVSMGPGNPDFVSARAKSVILLSDVLIGSKRMVNLAMELVRKEGFSVKPFYTSFDKNDIAEFLADHPEYENIAFLYSGDIRVYSGAQSITEIFRPNDRVHRIYGMSSVDYMAEKCGIPREKIQLVSVHGRNTDVRPEIDSHRYVMVLLGGSESLHVICRELAEDPVLGKIHVTLGECLSYPEEKFTYGTPEDFLDAKVNSLGIALFDNLAADRTEGVQIPRFMVAAAKSGGGKTTVTCALIRAMQNRGRKPAVFKCGPDYIDPMYHAKTLGVRTGNLDSFFTDPALLRRIFKEESEKSDLSIVEGVMGYYDGLGGTTERASSCEIAEILKIPVILVVDAGGVSVSLAAVVEGILDFRKPTQIAGLILNRVSRSFYPRMKKTLETELEKKGYRIPVLGYLPENKVFEVPSRHLGLISPEEAENRRNWADLLASQIEETVDLDRLEEIARHAPRILVEEGTKIEKGAPVRIAVARDEAFSFSYRENAEFLERLGAELVYFSPLHDSHFPQNVQGLVLGGGYPELFSEQLWKNSEMRKEVCEAVTGGLPTIAECGGYMYLLERLRTKSGVARQMCGAVSGEAVETGHLVRFGYFSAKTNRKGLFGPKGTALKGHEFHYWDTSELGDGLHLKKPESVKEWDEGIYTDTMAAGFPHFYYPGCPEAIRNFLDTCRQFK